MKPFVRVTWHDAADEEQTWVKESEIDDSHVEVISYGFLLKKTRSFIHLAADIIVSGTEEITWGRVCKIPKRMIIKVEEISLPETPKADPD